MSEKKTHGSLANSAGGVDGSLAANAGGVDGSLAANAGGVDGSLAGSAEGSLSRRADESLAASTVGTVGVDVGADTNVGVGALPTVKSIFIYPIKSCKGISVSRAPISPTGFVWDRHWMVINTRGRACTQRVAPKLALVQVELPTEAFSLGWEPNKSSYLVVRAPGMAELKVSLAKPSLRSDGVLLWEWTGSVLDEGDEAAKWFTDFLGKPSRLVRFNEESETRPADPHYASGFNMKFADMFPFLLISKASLDAVNGQLKEPVNINRFRPNIFIDGCESFAEDMWKEIKINELTFQGVMLCPRCKVPTINQENGTRGSEPIETMMKFRSCKALKLNTTSKYKMMVCYLGRMLVCSGDNKGKIVSVGDVIEVEKVFLSYADVVV